MLNIILIVIGKLISFGSRVLSRGHGSTWPGHIALSTNQNFIKEILLKNPHLKVILIAGTNGKTTTGKLIQNIIEKDDKKVFQNESGANLLNGIASTLILHSNNVSKLNYDFAIFEIDENTLPLILKQISPEYILLLNLFRDQLDRYGEVNTIANKWHAAFLRLSTKTKLVLNADDPLIAYLELLYKGGEAIPPSRWNRSYTSVIYFGIRDKSLHQKEKQHASDSTYCPNCGTKLEYSQRYYSHLGNWQCAKCNLKHPELMIKKVSHYPLPGVYNIYNTHAAVTIAKDIGISDETIEEALKTFKPAFGRQEVFEIDGKKIQIFLSKNPTSFNESLRTVRDLNGKYLLLLLNDRIPDGRDVSWIWDVDFETLLTSDQRIHVSGDRAYDMTLRIKYAHPSVKRVDTYPSLEKLFEENIFDNLKDCDLKQNETFYILPTYSAMLEVRKLLTGKKIL